MVVLVSACSVPHAPATLAGTKRVALTFDDVPRHPGAFLTEDQRTAMLIDDLKKSGVKQAAFFVTVGNLGQTTGGERRIAQYQAAGHLVANHTYSHPYLSKMSAEDFLADVDKADAWLKPQPRYRPWMRYPYLDEGGTDRAKHEAVAAGLAERGLRDAVVTIDGEDWMYDDLAIQAKADGTPMDMNALRDLWVSQQLQAVEFYDRLARESVGRSPRHVMLLHETDLAALFLPDLVAALRQRGWTIITADEAYSDPFTTRLPEGPDARGTITQRVAWTHGIHDIRWRTSESLERAAADFDRHVLVPGHAVRKRA